MKWIKRLALGLVALLVVCAVAVWLWLPPVNVPLRGMLANQFPGWFAAPTADAALVETALTVPEGYGISLFAKDVPDARMLRVTAAGDVLVASPGRGQVFWFARDADAIDGADERRVLLEGLDGPNGLDLHDGYLYVAEQGQVGRVRFDDAAGRIEGAYEVVIKDLPRGGNHWKKTIRFGPDGLLYVAIGSSCNVCLETDERRAALLRYRADGTYVDTYATGLRNSAGFDWRAADGALYATDNGRDLLGDDFPPCELNLIQAGGFYGWPFANGDRIADPDLGAGREAVIAASIPPAFAFRAHNAPLGIVFLESAAQPPAMRGAALVALHGSWNRSQKDGYKVVALHWKADGTITAEDFLTGFLTDSRVLGRPAELAEAADGVIYVSDDYANAVYQIVPGASGALTAVGAAAQHRDAVPAAPQDPALVAAGETAFAQLGCATCHVLNGVSVAGQVGLQTLSARYAIADLEQYLAQPRQPMPPVTDAAARHALAAFLLARAGS
jgi:glucose/arabinose dehydrogenase